LNAAIQLAKRFDMEIMLAQALRNGISKAYAQGRGYCFFKELDLVIESD